MVRQLPTLPIAVTRGKIICTCCLATLWNIECSGTGAEIQNGTIMKLVVKHVTVRVKADSMAQQIKYNRT